MVEILGCLSWSLKSMRVQKRCSSIDNDIFAKWSSINKTVKSLLGQITEYSNVIQNKEHLSNFMLLHTTSIEIDTLKGSDSLKK